MDFDEYQKLSRQTAIYSDLGKNYIYPALGLAGETGEVIEKIKKLMRDKNKVVDDDFKSDISKEMGDVLWYLSQLASEFNLSLDDIASLNIKKLFSRKERGNLHGDGDDR